jgi:multiple sugar transport system substrate-binding protein
MARDQQRKITNLADSYLSGRMSRRAFITRLVELGLTTGAAGAVLAACSSAATAGPSAAAATAGPAGTAAPGVSAAPVASAAAAASAPAGSKDLKGEIAFLVGPWTADEIKNQQVIQAGFNKLYPNVTFTYKLFDWGTAGAQVASSLLAGAHDIYWIGQATIGQYSDPADPNFLDLTSRIDDPAWASEKAKYLYWDYVESTFPRLIGLPCGSGVDNCLFVNVDMLQKAGYDLSFVEGWDTFAAALQKMTTNGVHGLGWGTQAYDEWYSRARAAGATFLSPDYKTVTINTPEVLTVTQQLVDLYKQGIAVPPGTYDYTTINDAFAAQRVAVFTSDCTIAPILQKSAKDFTWAMVPLPPGPKTRTQTMDLSWYCARQGTKDPDLAWEVLKWWTNGASDAFWEDASGSYPLRTDAAENGFGATAPKQLLDTFSLFQKYFCFNENFKQFGDVELASQQQAADAYTGTITAEQAVSNIEKATQKAVFC